ncbi:MAG: hypothetical protein WDZ94_03360 [Patescibacteria group bacterium]
MEVISQFLRSLFVVDSIWSIILQAVLWFVISIVIIISTDNVDPDINQQRVRANLGYLSIFLILSGLLFFMLFSYAPVPAA